jgi:hypothetical protein
MLYAISIIGASTPIIQNTTTDGAELLVCFISLSLKNIF